MADRSESNLRSSENKRGFSVEGGGGSGGGGGKGKSGIRSLENAKKEILSITNEIEKIGLISRANYHLKIYYHLKKSKKIFTKKKIFILTIFTILFFNWIKNYFVPTSRDKCFVDLPSSVQHIFRPAEDCSMCFGIQQVDKVSSIDPGRFEILYAYSGRPVVVTDATTNWTAPKIFSFTFFKSLYERQEANCQFFPYKTDFKNLQEVFNMSTDRSLQLTGTEPWYIGWSNCDEKIGNTLRKHYEIPYFLPINAESEKTDWIFMGSSGYGAHMHVDDVRHPSWQAQLKGEKLWILEPPRECYYTCERMTVTVKPGEIIVLDTNRWYHQTKIVSNEMSITIGAEFD